MELSTSTSNCSVVNCTGQNLAPTTSLPEGDRYILSWWIQLIFIVLFVGMVTVAAGGNIVVMWIVLAHKRMRTVTNYFLVNLAMADTLISLLNVVFNFIYMLHGNNWLFGDTYCRVSSFIATCTISASVLTFMAIAIDRYATFTLYLSKNINPFSSAQYMWPDPNGNVCMYFIDYSKNYKSNNMQTTHHLRYIYC